MITKIPKKQESNNVLKGVCGVVYPIMGTEGFVEKIRF